LKLVDTLPALPSRPADSHKGTFGHLLVLAGSPRMAGAAVLATFGGLRSGAGLVTLGIPAAIHACAASGVRSAMTLPLPATPAGTFSRDAIQPAIDFTAGRVTAIALGPGITTDDETVAFATRLVQRIRLPLVLDADGLNCAAKSPASLRTSPAPRILTPHPGEASRLLDRRTEKIQADRKAAAHDLAEAFGCVAVLKGHGTIVADRERMYVNRTGNAGMATGGAGDVLTGVIGGLAAQGMDPFDAAVLGVHVHGRAGDLAVREIGEISLIAEDLLRFLGPAFLSLA
jgi:NAD(P)H-hydrate epimerase